MPVKREIIYPILLECCQYAEDNFWKNTFEDLAYGKTPYGTYISKSFLCCGYKNKEFSYKIERKDSKVLYEDIYKLLTGKLGILSQKEKINKRIAFHKTEDRIKKSRQCWSQIKKKNVKDLLIERYVIDMKHKHSLTIKKAKKLLSIIFIAIVFKIITKNDIIYSDGKISNIEGISFRDGEISMEKNITNININFSLETAENDKLLSDNWVKYLESLRKIKQKHNYIKK